MMLTNGKVVIGNDGGMYYRPLSDDSAVRRLERPQRDPAQPAVLRRPRGPALAATVSASGAACRTTARRCCTGHSSQMDEPAGGDGFYVLVDPRNANNAVGEYTDLTMYSTTDGGHTFTSDVSPGCDAQETVGLTPRADCDSERPVPRAVRRRPSNIDTWIAGGEDVWVSTAGWNTQCNPTTCSWTKRVRHRRRQRRDRIERGARSHLRRMGRWRRQPGTRASATGIATNYGGTWHALNTSSLPNRYIAGSHRRSDQPGPRLRDLQRLQPTMDPDRGHRARVRDLERRRRAGPTSPATCPTRQRTHLSSINNHLGTRH